MKARRLRKDKGSVARTYLIKSGLALPLLQGMISKQDFCYRHLANLEVLWVFPKCGFPKRSFRTNIGPSVPPSHLLSPSSPPFRLKARGMKFTIQTPHIPALRIKTLISQLQNKILKTLFVTFLGTKMRSLYAKSQPSSFQTEGRVWGDRRTNRQTTFFPCRFL